MGSPLSLTIECVTMFERHAAPFIAEHVALARRLGAELLLAVDRVDPAEHLERDLWPHVVRVDTGGNCSSVLNGLLPLIKTDYVLLLDDDGRVSPAMERWLAAGSYVTAEIWKFLRAHLWEPGWWIREKPLFPNYCSWLTTVRKGQVTDQLHSKPVHGRGEAAPVMLEHHKFLVKTRQERAARIELYERIETGGGRKGLRPAYGLPEVVYRDTGILLAPLGDGTVREYEEHELRRVTVC